MSRLNFVLFGIKTGLEIYKSLSRVIFWRKYVVSEPPFVWYVKVAKTSIYFIHTV